MGEVVDEYVRKTAPMPPSVVVTEERKAEGKTLKRTRYGGDLRQ